jgi:hypothetical protein
VPRLIIWRRSVGLPWEDKKVQTLLGASGCGKKDKVMHGFASVSEMELEMVEGGAPERGTGKSDGTSLGYDLAYAAAKAIGKIVKGISDLAGAVVSTVQTKRIDLKIG